LIDLATSEAYTPDLALSGVVVKPTWLFTMT
jgi:hypothetical protein